MSIEVKSRVAQNALKMQEKHLRVAFLVGNGFDLGLGLKTAYSDFIKCYINRKSTPNAVIGNLIEEIEQNIETWGDAEYAFGRLPFDKLGNDAEYAFRVCLKDFQISLEEYLRNESARLILPAGKAENTRALLLRSIVETMASVNSSMFNDIDVVDIDIINFNYTDTVDRLFCSDGNRYPDVAANINKHPVIVRTNSLHHPHGKLGGNVLFGVDNSDQIGNEALRTLSKSDGYLVKSAKAMFGQCAFYNEANEVLFGCDVAVLFGLSYGKTDLSWWRNLTRYTPLSSMEGIYRGPTIILCSYDNNPIDRPNIDDSICIVRHERERFICGLKTGVPPSYIETVRRKLSVVGHGPFRDPVSDKDYYCDPLHLNSIGKIFVNGYDGTPIVNASL